MNRWLRLTMSLVLATCITGLYMMGGDYEVCGTECHGEPWGWKPFGLFIIALVVGLRLLKKIEDYSRRYD